MTRAVVVMGVSGCGKSTLAEVLAQTLGWSFIEGDALHPPANIQKMAAGIALDDLDRLPFLRSVAQKISESPQGAVAACSALKRSYRDVIRDQVGDTLFVLPLLPRPVLVERLATRRGHFMPMSLIDSQLATLQMPGPEEHAVILHGSMSLPEQIELIRTALGS